MEDNDKTREQLLQVLEVLRNEVAESKKAITECRWVEAALRESEERYRRLVESITDYIYTVRVENGRPVSTTHGPGCFAVTGYTSEYFQIYPHHWYDIIHEDDRKAVLEQAERILSGEAVKSLEHRIIHKDGSIRWVRNTPVPHYDKDGHLISYDGLISDITERKMAGEQLRIIFDNTTDGILLADIESKRFYIGNKRVCEMLGYSIDEIKVLGVMDIHPEKDLSYVIDQFERQARKEFTIAKDIPVKRKDGSVFYADINSSPVSLGGKTYLLGIFRDITERRKAEEAMRESEERFHTVAESAADAIICLKSPDTAYFWNRKAEEMFGHPADHVIGRPLHEIIVPERYRERARKGLRKFFETGTGPLVGKTIEIKALRRDRTEFPIELSISAMKIREEWQSMGIIRDISERKKAEEKIKEQLDYLERFKKVAVKREFRIKELMDEVEKLKARISEMEKRQE